MTVQPKHLLDLISKNTLWELNKNEQRWVTPFLTEDVTFEPIHFLDTL